MGRAKLEMKYREDPKVRTATYWNRLKGTKKKARELSLLCGIDVLLVSFSPELNDFQFWPEDASQFRHIAARYLSKSSVRPKSKKAVGNAEVKENPFLPSTSFLPSVDEDVAAIDRKLEEVRARISFLEGMNRTSQEVCDGNQRISEF